MQSRARSSYAEPQPAVYSHLNCEYKITKIISANLRFCSIIWLIYVNYDASARERHFTKLILVILVTMVICQNRKHIVKNRHYNI